jgi:hypothetical protein
MIIHWINELQGSVVSVPDMEHRPKEYLLWIVNATVEESAENASTNKHAKRLWPQPKARPLRSNALVFQGNAYPTVRPHLGLVPPNRSERQSSRITPVDTIAM